MAYNNLNEFISYLNNRTYQKERRYGQDVSVSIFFEQDGEKQQLVDHKGRENVSNIRNLTKFNPFDKIHVDLHENDKTVSFSFDAKNSPQQELTTPPDMPGQELTGFTGFGQAEVEEIVGKRLAEEKTRMELVRLRESVDQRDKKIEKLKQKISKLETKLDESGVEQEELTNTIKIHRGIENTVEVFGQLMPKIKESPIGQSLAGLFKDSSKTTEIEAPKEDASGIVEEEVQTTENPQANQLFVVDMISESLKKMSNETLLLIYEILVYVENDPINAAHIYSYLTENIKLRKDANLRIQSQDTSQQ
jgi:hypothetical protein